MSEGKTIIELLNEKTDKNFTFADYFIEIDTADETYKMSFATFFSGVFAPDGAGNIDIGNNNLINVNNITALNITANGTITGNSNDKNKISPFVSFKIDDGAGSPGTVITAIDNHVISAWSVEASPPAGQTGNYFEIPKAKCSQLFKLMYEQLTIGTLVLRFFRYNRVTPGYIDTGLSLTLTSDVNPGEQVIREIYDSSLLLTADEDLRVFIQTGFTNVGIEIGTIWALQ